MVYELHCNDKCENIYIEKAQDTQKNKNKKLYRTLHCKRPRFHEKEVKVLYL